MNRYLRFVFKGILPTFLISVLSVSAHSQETAESESLISPISIPSDSGGYAAINRAPEWLRRSEPFAREVDEFTRLAGTSGVFDKEGYLAAFAKAKQDLDRTAIADARKGFHNSPLASNWTNIGLNGTYGSIPSAGCIATIQIDPTNSNIIYAGASGGGVWKSIDGAQTWAPVTDNVFPNLSTASIAIDPKNPSNIYVGSGYCYSSEPSYGGSGVYKSADGGGTWQHVNVGGNGGFVKMLVHPTQNNVVFACAFDAQFGLFRSSDFGATWTKTFNAHNVVWDIAASVNGNTTTLFLVEGGNTSGGGAGAEAGIYKSLDDGLTWTKLSTTGLPAANSIYRSQLATPTHVAGHLFAIFTDGSGNLSGAVRSTDNGGSWTNIDVPTTLCQPASASGIPNPAQGWYDLYIAVSPYSNTHDTIYVAGVEAYVNMSDGLGWQTFSGYSDAVRDIGTHVDHHSFAFDPNNPLTVYDGNDGGIYRSNQGGLIPGTSTWSYVGTGIIGNRVYHIAIDPGSQTGTWAGLQDQGTWRIQTGKDPVMYHSGDGFQPLVSHQSSLLVYAENPNGEIYRAADYRQGFSLIAGTASLKDASGWAAPFQISPVSHGGTSRDNILYLGRQKLWQTTDGGSSWLAKGPTFPAGNGRYCTAIGLTNFDANIVYAGGTNFFEVSSDFGATWKTRPGINYEVSSIATNYQDRNFVVIALRGGSHCMVSHDMGATWAAAGASLPNVNCEAIAVDSTDPLHKWFIGTDVGMYMTTNAGQTWGIAGSGFGLYPVRDIQIAPNKTTMRVATFGRGVWEAQVPDLVEGPGSSVEFTSLHASKTATSATLSWTTSHEESGTTYSVQRSINGDSFESIGTVPGSGSGSNSYSFADNVASTRGMYLYRILAQDVSGTSHLSNQVELHFGIDQITLYQAYPNPFVIGNNLTTKISFEIPTRDFVTVRIYNSLGLPIRTIAKSEAREPGVYDEQWDGRDDSGAPVPAGGYFYSIETTHSGTTMSKLSVIKE